GFRSVLAAYPWSGHQFLDPSVDETEIRVIMGDADEWCSPMQVQGHVQAIRLSGGKATMRLIGGAQHSVDRDLMIYALKAGYGRKGARIGSRDGDAELFKADMLAFWRRTLG